MSYTIPEEGSCGPGLQMVSGDRASVIKPMKEGSPSTRSYVILYGLCMELKHGGKKSLTQTEYM